MLKCYIWRIELYSPEIWTIKNGAEIFEERRNVILEENGEDKMVRESSEGRNERIGEKRTFINNNVRRKAN